MIDYFNISIRGTDFPAIGKPLHTLQPSGVQTASFTETVVRPDRAGPEFRVQVELRYGRLRLSGCPLTWLQGHNGMGTNDFPAVVQAVVPLVFATLQLAMPDAVRAALADGSYTVHEVHVAELHRMPHALIPLFCDHIRRHAPSALQATPLEDGKGIGVRLWPHSRDRRVILYDKHHYFRDGLIKHRHKLLGNLPRGSFERIGTGLAFDRMLAYLRAGIRIETRFQRYLAARGLNRGSAWTAETARHIHFDVLNSLPLDSLPGIAEQEALLSQTTQVDERRLLALWLDGRRVKDFFGSDAAYYRWCQRFASRFGIDLSAKPVPTGGVRWQEVIAPTAVLEIPDWAYANHFVFDPDAVGEGDGAPYLERAWLDPAAAIGWPQTANAKRKRQLR